MIDKVRQKAAVEEKKKDGDLKKKGGGVPQSSRLLSLETPVPAARKVIREEQGDSNMLLETSDGDGFKDIVKAADAFTSRVSAGHGVDKDKIHRGRCNGGVPRKDLASQKARSKGNSKGNSGKLRKMGKKDDKGSKTWSHPER